MKNKRKKKEREWEGRTDRHTIKKDNLKSMFLHQVMNVVFAIV